jgi:hypothetical protein
MRESMILHRIQVRTPPRWLLLAVAALAPMAALASEAAAPGAASGHETFAALRTSTSTAVSSNWAGYMATGTSTTYTSVTATWKQPTVTCEDGHAGAASAFWVGLGGSSSASQALEQIGTSADCDSKTGKPKYYAWYELVPSPSVTIKSLKVAPGDLITTSVNITGSDTVLVQVKNRTRKTTFTKALTVENPDLSSAEWIAEAPSTCNGYRCVTLPLSNFGSVQFTKIAAIGNGIGGTLTANPGWTTTAISLVADNRHGFFPGPDTYAGASSSSAGASPGDASTDGGSFTVTWSSSDAATG